MASQKKNWSVIWAAVAAVAAVGALIFAGLTYFQPSPYKLEATGKHISMNLPSSVLNVNADDICRAVESPQATSQSKIIGQLASQFVDLVKFRQHFIFTLKNQGNKEVNNIKLVLPAGGLYEVLRTQPVGKTEKFANEIPVGNLSPTDEVTILVWTDKERAMDELDRMRFVHPDGVVKVNFESDNLRGISFGTLLLMVALLAVSALNPIITYLIKAIVKNPPAEEG